MQSEIENINRLMKNKGVQFRSFDVTATVTEKDGVEELVVEGHACPYDTETLLYSDRFGEHREKIASGAFDGADMSDVIFNYNHSGRVYARTRNDTLKLFVLPDGLHMMAHLRRGDMGHEALYEDIKSGIIDKMSIAFVIGAEKYDYFISDTGKRTEVKTIEKIAKLYDVSAVDIPAYDTTEISARSAFDTEREKRNAASIKRAALKLKLKTEGIVL